MFVVYSVEIRVMNPSIGVITEAWKRHVCVSVPKKVCVSNTEPKACTVGLYST